MKKLLPVLVFIFAVLISANSLHAQRILIDEDFETTGFGPDSLPPGWVKADVDMNNLPDYPFAVWGARDSGSVIPGVNAGLAPRAHNSGRCLYIPWRAGNLSLADDWTFTDSVSLQAGDSLIFWMLLGQPEDINFGGLIDSMQVLVAVLNTPTGSESKVATIISGDSDNVYTEYKFDLTPHILPGLPQYICFRYYMDTAVDGLWVNIDDVFVGNRSAVGISPIGNNVPTKFALGQNYPNPFNPSTKIKFDLAKNTNAKLVIFNSLGQEVKTLLNDFQQAGFYELEFNASDLPSGTYFYRLTTDQFTETKKMLLVK